MHFKTRTLLCTNSLYSNPKAQRNHEQASPLKTDRSVSVMETKACSKLEETSICSFEERFYERLMRLKSHLSTHQRRASHFLIIQLQQTNRTEKENVGFFTQKHYKCFTNAGSSPYLLELFPCKDQLRMCTSYMG